MEKSLFTQGGGFKIPDRQDTNGSLDYDITLRGLVELEEASFITTFLHVSLLEKIAFQTK